MSYKKNSYTFFLTYFIINLLLFSCINKTKNKFENKIIEKEFKKIVEKFKVIKLPLDGIIDENKFDIFDFTFVSLEERYRDKRIPIDLAIKYFFNGDKMLNNQPSGGIYEHYYGYKILKKDFLILLYLRPSDDTYSYRISTFDYDGNIIDDLGIAGGIRDWVIVSHKEFFLNKALKVETKEITYDERAYSEELGVEVEQINKYYQITPTGKIKLLEQINVGKVMYVDDPNDNYARLILKENNNASSTNK